MSLQTDSLGMFDATVSTADQVVAGVKAAAGAGGLPDPDAVSSVLVLGMGGSGLVGDFLAVTAGPFMSMPVVVVKNYDPPFYVSRNTLVFAVSFSGETEETLQSAAAAARLGGQMVAVTTGGSLAGMAEEWGAPCLLVDSDLPMPRAAFAAMAVPVLVYLEELGFFRGASEWLSLSVDQLRRRADGLAELPNGAQRLAQELTGAIPIVYGPGGLGEVAARRWKNQINENAKSPAFSAGLPEMLHNELVGWEDTSEVEWPYFCPIILRHDFENPQVQLAIEALGEMFRDLLGDSVKETFEVRAGGEGPIAQIFDLMLFGDFVSLYLAEELNIDPGPVASIDRMKARLSGGGSG